MVKRRAGGRIARNRRGGGALGCLVPLLIITIIGYYNYCANYYYFQLIFYFLGKFIEKNKKL